MLITCATIAQSYLLMITAPMLGISGGTQAILRKPEIHKVFPGFPFFCLTKNSSCQLLPI